MAINILSNVLNNINNGQMSNAGNVGAGANTMRQAATAMLNELRSLMPGDTITGQLVSKDGSGIQLLLSNNTMLNTVLDEDVNLGVGSQVTFEVRSNHSGQLTLRPMFTNLNNSSTIMSALDAAGIPASDATIEMVDSLMQKGMPIDKSTLQMINREINMYPDADVEDIVMLHKMDIPVDSNTVNQMHMYRSNNQWMLDNVNDSASQMTDMLTDSLVAGDENLATLLDGLKELLPPSEEMTEVSDNNAINSQIQTSENILADVEAESVSENTHAVNDAKDTVVNGNAVQAQTANAEELKESDNASQNTQTNKYDINKFNIFDKLKTIPKDELKNPEVREAVRKAVTDLLKDNMLMDPKEVGEEKYVKKYYEKTNELTANLERLLTQTGKNETEFAKTVTNMRDNTSFMNQINELYNYVQLPLKMNDAHANGDLYVYTRKKGHGGGGEDGKLTALLHLSMEHLGNMDVFLTLEEGQKLSTRFTLEKEEMIDFIEAHIDELNARLINKGYNVGTTVTKMDDKAGNVIENIVGDDGNNILLSTQSFDARA